NVVRASAGEAVGRVAEGAHRGAGPASRHRIWLGFLPEPADGSLPAGRGPAITDRAHGFGQRAARKDVCRRVRADTTRDLVGGKIGSRAGAPAPHCTFLVPKLAGGADPH